MGLSREIINSPETLSTLETLTIFFIFHGFTPPVGIAEELMDLSLSNGNALERIRFYLQCDSRLMSGASHLGYLESLNLNHVHRIHKSELYIIYISHCMCVGLKVGVTSSCYDDGSW